MSDDDAQPHDLDEVLRLATVLAKHMLATEIPTRSINPARSKALVGAAEFLHDNDVPWPAAVQEALDKITEHLGSTEPKVDDGATRG